MALSRRLHLGCPYGLVLLDRSTDRAPLSIRFGCFVLLYLHTSIIPFPLMCGVCEVRIWGFYQEMRITTLILGGGVNNFHTFGVKLEIYNRFMALSKQDAAYILARYNIARTFELKTGFANISITPCSLCRIST